MRWLYVPPDGAWAPIAAFGSPKPPAPPPPQAMPDIQDPALLTNRRKLLEAAMARGGRLSTMLTDDNSYNRDTLGLR
jgi:hypothetical protein